MKVETITPKDEFKPVTIQLTFETQEELNVMYAVVNCGGNKVWDPAKNSVCNVQLPSDSAHWVRVKTEIYKEIKHHI